MELTRLFRCTNQFAFLEHNEPQYQGDCVPDPVISWSGPSMFCDGPDTRLVIASTAEEAEIKMKNYILSFPEKFGFLGQYLGSFTTEERRTHFKKAFEQRMDEKNPKLGQHRIKVEEIGVIF